MRKEVRISQVDAVFSNGSYPIEFLFFYEPGFDTKRVRGALEKLSSIFWPAFGEYGDGMIAFDRYREADCFDEEGVDGNLDISESDEYAAELILRFSLPPLRRLFFLKVIRFRNGLALIPKLNHLAGDGYSYFLLLSFLAAFSRPSRVPFKSALMGLALKPHHRRQALRDFSFRGAALEPQPSSGPLRLVYNEIRRRDVQSVIQEAAASAGLRISTNDVLCAMILKTLVKIGAQTSAEDCRLTIPIDVRGKVAEYGRGFFGNGIMFHTTSFKKERLENAPHQEIAGEIRKSMPLLNRETYVHFLRGLEEILAAGRQEEFRPYDPDRGCLVTNLSRLPADRLDFGTGPPKLVIPLTVERNGAGILAKKEDFVLRFAY